MRTAVRWFVVFGILLLTFGLPILLQQVISPGKVAQLQLTPTPTVTTQATAVTFASVPPVIVAPKSQFVYKVVASASNGEPVQISVISKPDWVTWANDTKQLTGAVPSDSGVFSVDLQATATTGETQEQTFTVTIDVQKQVKGATTVSMWKDPFHPNPLEVQAGLQNTVTPVVAQSDNLLPAVGEEQVLGATTIAPQGITTSILLTGAIVGALVIGVIALIVKVVQVARSAPHRNSVGVIIERGGK